METDKVRGKAGGRYVEIKGQAGEILSMEEFMRDYHPQNTPQNPPAKFAGKIAGKIRQKIHNLGHKINNTTHLRIP